MQISHSPRTLYYLTILQVHYFSFFSLKRITYLDGLFLIKSEFLPLSYMQNLSSELPGWEVWRNQQKSEEEMLTSGRMRVAISNILCNERFYYIRVYQVSLGRTLWGN